MAVLCCALSAFHWCVHTATCSTPRSARWSRASLRRSAWSSSTRRTTSTTCALGAAVLQHGTTCSNTVQRRGWRAALTRIWCHASAGRARHVARITAWHELPWPCGRRRPTRRSCRCTNTKRRTASIEVPSVCLLWANDCALHCTAAAHGTERTARTCGGGAGVHRVAVGEPEQAHARDVVAGEQHRAVGPPHRAACCAVLVPFTRRDSSPARVCRTSKHSATASPS